LQNSWIWELLLVLALCAALAFFLIEVWQIVEFIYRWRWMAAFPVFYPALNTPRGRKSPRATRWRPWRNGSTRWLLNAHGHGGGG
jgi:hypothetical protein